MFFIAAGRSAALYRNFYGAQRTTPGESLAGVVLPQPAGAEMRVNWRRIGIQPLDQAGTRNGLVERPAISLKAA